MRWDARRLNTGKRIRRLTDSFGKWKPQGRRGGNDDLLITMTDEQKESFEKFRDFRSESGSLSDEALFEYDFKLGARSAMETINIE